MDTSNIGNLDFETLQTKSQSCSKEIVFNLINKTKTVGNSLQEIQDCKKFLEEYKKRLMIKNNLESLNPLKS